MKTFLIILAILISGLIAFFAFRTHQTPASTDANQVGTPSSTPVDFTLTPPADSTMLSLSEGIYTVGDILQISVTDYDEPGPITEERIRQDLPDAEINEPGQAKLDGTVSFLFYGHDEDLGETFEVWAVHSDKLFQIMGRKEDEKMIEKILNTWKWQ